MSFFERVRLQIRDVDEREMRAIREGAEFLERQKQALVARIARGERTIDVTRFIRTIDRRTLLALGCVGAGAALVLAGTMIPAVGEAGSGYFVRAGILLGGVGLTMLLRPS